MIFEVLKGDTDSVRWTTDRVDFVLVCERDLDRLVQPLPNDVIKDSRVLFGC